MQRNDTSPVAHGRVFLTGILALARLPMLQHARDRASGLNTAGYISGYRCSPLGGLDRGMKQLTLALLVATAAAALPAVPNPPPPAIPATSPPALAPSPTAPAASQTTPA